MKLAKTLIVSQICAAFALISISFTAHGADTTPSKVGKKTQISPWMRLSSPLNYMRLSPEGNLIAFTNENGMDLRVLEVRTANVYEVTKHFVGASFVWAPDDCRLFFTEKFKTQENNVENALRSYDCSKKTTSLLDSYSNAISFLTFDPRDMKLHLLSKGILHRKTVNISNQRLDAWKVSSKLKQRRWITAEGGIFLFSNDGKNVTKLNDDESGIQSFDLSSDGENIVWATKQGQIFVSFGGDESVKICDGFDPRWHPSRPLIAFSSIKKLGSKITGMDLAVIDEEGKVKELTNTNQYRERWPNWGRNDDQIVFTIEGTTDIFVADFKDL